MNIVRNPTRRSPLASRFDAEAAALEHQILDGGTTARSARADSRRLAPVPATTRTSSAGVLPCQVHDPDLWFADAPGDLERAKALCAGCPVRLACLTGALDRREPTGVWGGQILDNGEIVSHKRPRGRPRTGSTTPQRHQSRPPGPLSGTPSGTRPSVSHGPDRCRRATGPDSQNRRRSHCRS